jgi:hypothetical protein
MVLRIDKSLLLTLWPVGNGANMKSRVLYVF